MRFVILKASDRRTVPCITEAFMSEELQELAETKPFEGAYLVTGQGVVANKNLQRFCYAQGHYGSYTSQVRYWEVEVPDFQHLAYIYHKLVIDFVPKYVNGLPTITVYDDHIE